MSVYVFSQKNRPGLDSLISALGAGRLYRFDGESFWDKKRKSRLGLQPGSVVIPWGVEFPFLDDLRVLNGRPGQLNKIEETALLTQDYIGRPTVYKARDGSPDGWKANSNYILRKFGEALDPLQPVPHVEADYYSQKVEVVKEYVVHSFGRRSIRAGAKVPKGGRPIAQSEQAWKLDPTGLAHPWIRSEAGGWEVNYSEGSTAETRAVAHKAVKLLGLTFGEVNVGVMAAGQLVVFGIGTCPDLSSPNAVKAYAKAINKWILEGASNASGI